MAVLGAMLLNPGVCRQILGILQPQFFLTPRHKAIYQCCADLVEAGEAPDMVTVSSRLRGFDGFNPAYLPELLEACPAAGHGMFYARELIREYEIYALQVMLPEAAKSGNSERIYACADAIRRDCLMPESNKPKTLHQHFDDTLEEIDNAKTRGPEILWGFPSLDFKTGGLRRGMLHIIAARPGSGKTAWCSNVALTVAGAGHRVLDICLEQSPRELCKRFVGIREGVVIHDLIAGRLEEHQWEQTVQFRSRDDLDRNIILPGVETADIRSIDAMVCRHKPDLVIVDQLQLLDVDVQKGSNVPMSIGNLVRQLKLMAVRNNAAVLLCSQVGDKYEGQKTSLSRPRIWQIYGSQGCRQFAQVIALLYWPAHDYCVDKPLDYAELHIDKNSDGPEGCVYLRFDAPTNRFTEAGRQDAEPAKPAETPAPDWTNF